MLSAVEFDPREALSDVGDVRPGTPMAGWFLSAAAWAHLRLGHLDDAIANGEAARGCLDPSVGDLLLEITVPATPAAGSPNARPASVTPMPPGTGISPANSATTVLISRNCDRGRWTPNAWADTANAMANRTWVSRLPPKSRSSLDGDRSTRSASLVGCRALTTRRRRAGTSATTTTAITSTATTMRAMVAAPDVDDASCSVRGRGPR